MGEGAEAPAERNLSSSETGGPDRHTAWLATVNPDGRPHVMPVGTLYVDDTFYFTAGPKTRKAMKDRKSTRLNSSYANISYAVFCLKKKIATTSSRGGSSFSAIDDSAW